MLQCSKCTNPKRASRQNALLSPNTLQCHVIWRWWWCLCPRTWGSWPVACPRTSRRAMSLACGNGGCVATSTEKFSHFHHGKAIEKGAKQCILAWRPLGVAALWALKHLSGQSHSASRCCILSSTVWVTNSTWRLCLKSCHCNVGSPFYSNDRFLCQPLYRMRPF